MRIGLVALAITLLAAPLGAGADGAETAPGEERGRGVVRRIVTYVPSRIFDALDMVRLRARVGRGMAVGLRATELADFYLGAYSTVYAGLPGPRGRVRPRLPAGLESRVGVELGAGDATFGGGTGPSYGSAEVGAGLQVMLLGFDVGVDPFEILDFLGGLVLLDPGGDDF